ncbi:hypothetical protein [Streptomyces sp. NPDC007264]|uniref:hypothetical protein n=1 Tax=Streptomyces sp. NPDC007264 TaxID=3364777 RepID=UPI0036DE06E3
MVHAAPPARTTAHMPVTTAGTPVTAYRPPDVFDRRAHMVARVAGSVLLGLVYGYWAAANRRSGGPITGWNVLFGLVCAVVFAALCIGMLRVAPRLARGAHALLWAVFTGIALGFLYSQTGQSVLRSCGLALAVAAAVFLFDYYRYYTPRSARRRADTPRSTRRRADTPRSTGRHAG